MDTADGKWKRKTCLEDHHTAPGYVTANLMHSLRGHKAGIANSCKCSVGWVLQRTNLSTPEGEVLAGPMPPGAELELVQRPPRKGKGCPGLKPFALHTFNATYFADQLVDCRTFLPLDEAIYIMDYSMSYTTKQQRAVQSTHWSPEQVRTRVAFAFDFIHKFTEQSYNWFPVGIYV